ncbi:MAG: ATP synthase F1 subunit delta [Balneolales bacterium]
MSAKAARRYSSALLNLAREQKKTKAVLKDVEFINSTIRSSKELRLFLKSKIINQEKKQAVTKEIFGNKVSDLTREFLTFLVSKNREGLLFEVTNSLLADYNKSAGILDVQVFYPDTMGKDQADHLKTVLEKKTGKKINLILKKDASLKGGLTVKIEDTVIDGSLKNKLKKLESLLLGSAA